MTCASTFEKKLWVVTRRRAILECTALRLLCTSKAAPVDTHQTADWADALVWTDDRYPRFAPHRDELLGSIGLPVEHFRNLLVHAGRKKDAALFSLPSDNTAWDKGHALSRQWHWLFDGEFFFTEEGRKLLLYRTKQLFYYYEKQVKMARAREEHLK